MPAKKPTNKNEDALSTHQDPQDTDPFSVNRMTLRFDSAEQKQFITDQAKKNRRTMNDEVLFRLFPPQD